MAKAGRKAKARLAVRRQQHEQAQDAFERNGGNPRGFPAPGSMNRRKQQTIKHVRKGR